MTDITSHPDPRPKPGDEFTVVDTGQVLTVKSLLPREQQPETDFDERPPYNFHLRWAVIGSDGNVYSLRSGDARKGEPRLLGRPF